jgi:hypothetical protein
MSGPENPQVELAPESAFTTEQRRVAREFAASKRVGWLGAAVSLVYGILARVVFGLNGVAEPLKFGEASYLRTAFAIMSFAFLFIVPFSMGFALGFSQLPALLALALALALAWEGLICIVFWLPAYVALTAVGGFVAWLVLRRQNHRSLFGVVLFLPYGAALTEHQLPTALQNRQVETQISIQAPPEAVWEEIVDVPLILENEHGFAWSHLIGFPRPVSARSSSRSVGALREARFEGGIVFYERLTRYEPNVALDFDIAVDHKTIPKDALDEHVALGGPYFDVLQGSYRIEAHVNGVTLHLSSTHRLSTHFNGYASLWTDFVMRDTQDYILKIVARRAEQRAAAPSSR